MKKIIVIFLSYFLLLTVLYFTNVYFDQKDVFVFDPKSFFNALIMTCISLICSFLFAKKNK